MDGFSTSTDGAGRSRSSRLAAMLADPVVQAVMACDGVSVTDVAGAFEGASAALAASRSGARAARLSEPERRRAPWKL